jgi:cytochrome b
VPVRVFHWLMVASFAGAYLTAESERWRLLHVTLGYTMAGLVRVPHFLGPGGHPLRALFIFPARSAGDSALSQITGERKPEHHTV